MSDWKAPNPNFRDVVTGLVGSMPAAQFIGFKFEDVEAGYVALTLESRDELMEHQGAFQGGVIGALIDFAGASANGTLLEEKHMLMTLDYSVKLLAPAKSKVLVAEGRVLNSGGSIATASVSVWNENPVGKPCATGLVTTRSFRLG